KKHGENGQLSVMSPDELVEAIHDGGGFVTRDFLLRNFPPPDGIDGEDRDRYLHDLLTCKKFEMTYNNSNGQIKGHFLVVEDGAALGGADMVFREDFKGEIKTITDKPLDELAADAQDLVLSDLALGFSPTFNEDGTLRPGDTSSLTARQLD